MSGLPWIKVGTEITDHPKAIALARRLENPAAVGYVLAVWCFFARFYPFGRAPAGDDTVIAIETAAHWTGPRGALLEALEATGWMSKVGHHVVVHDWDLWQSAHAEKMARDRAKSAKLRKEQKNSRATVARPSRDSRALEGEGEEREKETKETLAPAEPSPPRKRAKVEKATDPRHRPMQSALEATFKTARRLDYGFLPRDARAVKDILALSGGNEGEACDRFARGLRAACWEQHCNTFSDLVVKWNALGAVNGKTTAPPRRLTALPAEPWGAAAGEGSPSIPDKIAEFRAAGNIAEADRWQRLLDEDRRARS